MKNSIKEIFAQADEKQRLKYLLAKDDIDDIQAAVVILKERLSKEFPDLLIRTHTGKMKVECESERHYTKLEILLKEEHLILKYNEYGTLELFNPKPECDLELVNKIRIVILSLGFYLTDESWTKEEKYYCHNETYKIDVIRRKL